MSRDIDAILPSECCQWWCEGPECLAWPVTQMIQNSLPTRFVTAVQESPVSRVLDRVLTAVTGPFVPSDDNPARSEVLGHSLHPMLTDLPLGCWTATTLVDVLGGRSGRTAATNLLAVGLLAAAPTAYTGLASWSRLQGTDRHVGAVHAVGNDVAIAFFVASLVARTRGQHGRGVGLALLGNLTTAAAGQLGGHLALNRGTARRA